MVLSIVTKYTELVYPTLYVLLTILEGVLRPVRKQPQTLTASYTADDSHIHILLLSHLLNDLKIWRAIPSSTTSLSVFLPTS